MTIRSSKVCFASVLLGATVLSGQAAAQSAEQPEQLAALSPVLDRIVVVASQRDPWEIPGATTVLDAEDLAKQEYGDILRILRLVPGVSLQEEDGYGLRPNIGLRGTGLERASKITLMEDGVLIAPAPYAASAAYYFPRAARMAGVEVTKGPAAVKYGPYTTGGAINLISTPIPEETGGFVNLIAGENGHLEGHAAIGTTYEGLSALNVGVLLETLQEEDNGFKVLDNGDDTGFTIEDYVAKVRLSSKPGATIQQSLEFKVQYSEEVSDETYLGLTDADFAATPFRRYAGSQEDRMTTDHKGFQLTHAVDFGNGWDLTTMGYLNKFRRDWFKLDRVVDANLGSVSISSLLENPGVYTDAFAAVSGLAGYVSADDALAVKHNNRAYEAKGVQSVLGYAVETGSVAHDLELSVRYHEDEEDRFQWVEGFRMDNGTMVNTSVGAPGSDSNRISKAEAWAFFIRDEMTFDRLTVVPGLRYETISYTRLDYGKVDPDRTGAALSVRKNKVDAFIPSLAVSYLVDDDWQVFGGIHKGFAPSGPGSASSEETSINYELGTRWRDGVSSVEAVGFFNDYSNLIGTCTLSSGGNCAPGDQFDGGKVETWGIELVAATDLASAFNTTIGLPVSVTYTLTQAEFKTGFNSGFEEWGNVNPGDELPYIPDHQLTLRAGVEADALSVDLVANYVSAVRVVAGSGAIAANEKIGSRFVVDVSATYEVREGVALYAAVQNLFDETYAVARRPAGLRPGKPQTVLGGLKVSF